MSTEKATKWRSQDSVPLQLVRGLDRRIGVPAIEKRCHLFDGPLEEGLEEREENRHTKIKRTGSRVARETGDDRFS
jgi:hypothetical protein